MRVQGQTPQTQVNSGSAPEPRLCSTVPRSLSWKPERPRGLARAAFASGQEQHILPALRAHHPEHRHPACPAFSSASWATTHFTTFSWPSFPFVPIVLFIYFFVLLYIFVSVTLGTGRINTTERSCTHHGPRAPWPSWETAEQGTSSTSQTGQGGGQGSDRPSCGSGRRRAPGSWLVIPGSPKARPTTVHPPLLPSGL